MRAKQVRATEACDDRSAVSNVLQKGGAFRRSEDGAVTIFGLYTFLISMMVLGLALDRANGWRVRTQLQNASDAAALAAAANLNDIDFARQVAMETARRNLPDSASLRAEDLIFGHLDPDTLEFTSGPAEDDSYNAVAAVAGRNSARGNELDTFLMSVIGFDTLDINVGAVAVQGQATGQTEGATCHDAFFYSTQTVDTGGGNDYDGAVCVHGVNGVHTGGGDQWNENVRFTAEDPDDITLNSYSPSDLTEDDLIGQRTASPMLLNELDNMRDSLFDDLWVDQSEDPTLWYHPPAPWGGTQWYQVGEYTISQADYDGILPSFVFDASGNATVHMRDQYWSIQPDDVEEHTIYISEATMQFSGGIDIENAAFISAQDLGVGGGSGLKFDDVYFIGSQVNMAGSITWGDPTNPCDVDYGVYIFGTTSLSLGGWYSGASVNGMVGAAPQFDPGGAMQGTGVYFETDSALSMGGNYDLYGCENQRSSELSIIDPALQEDGAIVSSLLYR